MAAYPLPSTNILLFYLSASPRPFSFVSCSDIDREVVAIALSYFDRYVSNHTAIAETLFQLVAMTSLYLAVKLHSTRKISVSSMVSGILWCISFVSYIVSALTYVIYLYL